MANSTASSIIHEKLSPRINSHYCTKLQFNVLISIINKMPHQYFDVNALEIPESIKDQLADPDLILLDKMIYYLKLRYPIVFLANKSIL